MERIYILFKQGHSILLEELARNDIDTWVWFLKLYPKVLKRFMIKKKEEYFDVSYKDIQIEARPSFKGLEPLEVVPNRPSDIFGRKQGSYHYNRDAAYQAGIDKPIPSAMRGILYKNIDEWEIIDQLPSPKSTTELDWIDFENTI
jgi:hypothetical protein